VGDGGETDFWRDCWCGNVPFCVRFRRLFDLAVNKVVTVRNMFQQGLEVAGGRGSGVVACGQDSSSDRWLWLPDPIGGYTVCGVYDMLTSQDQPILLQNSKLIWHKQVPLKVSIFVWHLLRDRLPTKQNLALRGVLPMKARSCIAGCGHVEDLNRIFLSCPFFGASLAWCGWGRDSVYNIPFLAIH
jgi:hypothetical protein